MRIDYDRPFAFSILVTAMAASCALAWAAALAVSRSLAPEVVGPAASKFLLNCLILCLLLPASIWCGWQSARKLRRPEALAYALAASMAGVATGWAVAIELLSGQAERLGLLGRLGSYWATVGPEACALAFGVGLARSLAGLARDQAAANGLAAAALQSAQVRALQSDLEGHFLRNCLSSSEALLARDGRSAALYFKRLAALLEAMASDSRKWVTVAEELSFLDRYLRLVQISLDGRLRWHLSAGSEAGSLEVPRLLLQPLVENAVLHGLAGSGGEIRVEASANGARLVLKVENQAVMGGPRPGSPRSGHGLGLAHVRRRLAATYEDDASLSLRLMKNGGSVAELQLPLRGATGGSLA